MGKKRVPLCGQARRPTASSIPGAAGKSLDRLRPGTSARVMIAHNVRFTSKHAGTGTSAGLEPERPELSAAEHSGGLFPVWSYCVAAGGAAGPINDRSGACAPQGSATTAEIEFCGEPLTSRSVHTTYTKLLCGASQNRLTCSRLNSTERFSVKASSPFSKASFTLIGPVCRTATDASEVSSASPSAP